MYTLGATTYSEGCRISDLLYAHNIMAGYSRTFDDRTGWGLTKLEMSLTPCLFLRYLPNRFVLLFYYVHI